MNISEYQVVDPAAGTMADLEGLARRFPLKAERLVRALEDFVKARTRYACRVSGTPDGRPDGRIEIFMVPPRYVLRHVPDAAALVRVQHDGRRIELIHIFMEFGGADETRQWQRACRIADEALSA